MTTEQEIKEYNVFGLGFNKKIKTLIKARNTNEMYKEFIKRFRNDCIISLEKNRDCLICWVKDGAFYNENGQKELIKFKDTLKTEVKENSKLNPDGTFECLICEQLTNRKQDMTRHLHKQHGILKTQKGLVTNPEKLNEVVKNEKRV